MTLPIFSWPITPKAQTKIDVTFCDTGYATGYGNPKSWMVGCQHPGWDWNLVTGGDSDLGYPLKMSVPGTIRFAGFNTSASWGGIVLLRADEWVRQYFEDNLKVKIPVLERQMAHLSKICVRAGMRVEAGEVVGSIGKGKNNAFLAHLHEEWRKAELAPDDWNVKNKQVVLATRIDPAIVYGSLQFDDRSNVLPQGQLYLPTTKVVINGSAAGAKGFVVNASDKVVQVRTEK